MINRIDGQIWIDRNQPHRLKYHIDGVDYIVEVSAGYYFNTAEGQSLSAGTVVKLIDDKTIAPASFPQDLDNVLGIALNTTKADMGVQPVAVSRNGYVVLLKEDLNNSFIPEDLDVTKNGWGDEENVGIGCPIYWYSGRVVKNAEGEYFFNSPKGNEGKITFSTPAGFRWNIKAEEDSSLNISYKNLPQIGNVARYTVENNLITSMSIHLNFSKFDESIEWIYPAYHTHKDGLNGLIHYGENIFRHGLFVADMDSNCIVDVRATSLPDKPLGGKYTIQANSLDNIIESYTSVNFNIPKEVHDTLGYRISGVVTYEIDEA